MAPQLIITKMSPPRLPRHLIRRPRLSRRLEDGLNAELILVSAPAGSGKSTLLGHWIAELQRPTAWLSLDPEDDDLERFLLYLVGALQQVGPELAAGLPDLWAVRGPVQAGPPIIELINAVTRFGEPLLLVLDDYHVITRPAIHDAVEFLLDHLPRNLCVVVSTRTDPPLGLARLRVRGQLLEIRADALRFDAQDTHAFLNEALQLELSQQAITSLEARTEGWIAGLQLAALSLTGRQDKERFVKQFAGSHRYLVAYLMDEVLARQTPELRQFLQRTAILERFTPELCSAVSGQPQSPAVLEHLVAANLFVIALDDEQRWYRYHHLFAEFLRHRLHEAEADLIPELHRRASDWFAAQGWTDEAIVHALAAPDLRRAGGLIGDVAFNLGVYWNSARFLRLVAGLPLDLIATLPRLSIYYAWPLINMGQVSALAAFEPVVARSADHSAQPRLMTALATTLRAYQSLWRMDFAGALRLAQAALTVLEEADGDSASDEERFLQVGVTNLIAYAYMHSDVAAADRFYPTALARSRAYGNLGSVSFTRARQGRVKHRLGQLHAAWGVFQAAFEAVRTAQQSGETRVVNVAELCASTARLLYEWDRLAEAQAQLQAATGHSERSQYTPVQALEHQTRAELHLARGEFEMAQAGITELERLAEAVDPANAWFRLRFLTAAMRLRLRLAEAHPAFAGLREAVASWVDASALRPDDAFAFPAEEAYHVLAVLRLAQGRPAEALELLEKLTGAASQGRDDDLIRYRLLQAQGHTALGQPRPALERLVQALELAEPHGYVRSFLDAGPWLWELLGRVREGSPQRPYARRLLERCPPVGSAHQPLISPALSGASDPGTEPLSERERAVLRLMAAGQTYKEIARQLQLAPNTVRWYMQNLNAKLGASNRVEAVNRARATGQL